MKNIDWQKVINKSWYYTKIFFICSSIILGAYGYGTFNPNEYAEKKIFKIAENDYLVKVKNMELVEPSMEYTNDVQFVRALHRCIDYINFTLPHSKRVPFEMIIGQAALESGWVLVDSLKRQRTYLVLEYSQKIVHTYCHKV